MSWASTRQTSRLEDQAYCLLGIFSVNIPMIYGEGSKAFLRLQEAILSKTADLSIFAWRAISSAQTHRRILAVSPAEFRSCAFVEPSEDQFSFRDEISLTNRGVKIQVPVQSVGNGTYFMELHCYDENPAPTSMPQRLGIYLRRSMDTYFRHMPHELARAEIAPSAKIPRPIFLAEAIDDDIASTLEAEKECRKIVFEFPPPSQVYVLSDIRAVPEAYWDMHEQYFSIGTLASFTGFLRFSITSRVLLHYGTMTEQTTSFILVCDLSAGEEFQMSLYAQTGLQTSPKPPGFIDPFQDIDQYGPLGDPFSLSVLRPGQEEDRSVSIIHQDLLHNYTVSSNASAALCPSLIVRIGVVAATTDDDGGRYPILGGPELARRDCREGRAVSAGMW